MLNKRSLKIVTMLFIGVLLSVAIISQPASGLISQNNTSWFTTSDTSNAATAIGDVNGDGVKEIVTAGYFNDGTRFVAQLSVWNATTLALEQRTSWCWLADNSLSSVAIANITGGNGLDIVTGGAFFDGTRWIAQLIVWNGTSLVAEKMTSWFWTGDTEISSVAVANVTGGSSLDIVTGGAFFDNTRWIAQLIVWNSTTMAAQKISSWFWTSNTYINALTIANVTGGSSLDIVTGGAFFDNTRLIAQLIVWNSTTMAAQRLTSWFWTSDTTINTLAVTNVTGGSSPDIVTGGTSFDNTRLIAQLIVWNSTTMAAQRLTSWFWTSDTTINSIAIANYTGGSSLDIFTAGSYNDGLRNNAQLIDWNSSTLVAGSIATWFTTSNTVANSIAIGNLGITGNRIVVGGSCFDGTRENAQITIWG
jgi:hypothetical protein